MRILYITSDLSEKNGWSTYTTNLIRVAIKDPKNILAVLAHDVEGYTHPRLRIYKMNFRPEDLVWNPFYIYLQCSQYKQVISEFKPDIIHVIVEPLSTPLGVSRIETPFVISVHGTYAALPNTLESFTKRIFCGFFYRRALQRALSIISVSNATEKRISSAFPSIKNKICVIHNSVFTDTYSQQTLCVRTSQSLHIVTVGEVKKRKGIHETIGHLTRWAKQNKRTIIYDVVGKNNPESPYVKMLNDLIKTHDSRYFSVVFHGQVSGEEKRQILSQASMYSHLERVDGQDEDVEGFGIGIIEANAHGLPVIVLDGSATAEAVQDGRTGYVFMKDELEESANTKISNILIGNIFLQKDLQAWVDEHSLEAMYQKVLRSYRNNDD